MWIPSIPTASYYDYGPEKEASGFVAFIWISTPHDGHIWVEVLKVSAPRE
jgi:hypothetical protein